MYNIVFFLQYIARLDCSSTLPYSAYISRAFNIARLESFAKLIPRIFGHFEVEPHWRRIEQRIREIISTKFKKTAIRENLDPRNISAIRYYTECSKIIISLRIRIYATYKAL